MNAKSTAGRRLSLAFALTLLLGAPAAAVAAAPEPLNLAVHPVLSQAETVKQFKPMADYLSSALGRPVNLVTNSNFLTHWQMMKRGGYHLVLDGPHFTDYRIKKMGYAPLVKFPDVVSYSLVASDDNPVLDAQELIGKPIATTPSPALGALRLVKLYPNPSRQPTIVETDDSETAAQKVLKGQAAGAIIPTPLVGRFPHLITVITTEQVPAPALSASPQVPADVRDAVRKALLTAAQSEAGKKALEAANVTSFVEAKPADYDGQANLLSGVWDF